MDKTFLSRQYLESVSTADLITLADDYGIDIPDSLNRRFIISELLDVAEDLENEKKSDSKFKIDKDVVEKMSSLPLSYNETQISVILRNPAWVFVFWDLKDSDLKSINRDSSFTSLSLHVSFYNDRTMEKIVDSFDIQISLNDREQYVLIPGGKKYFTIALCKNTHSQQSDILAISKCVEIQQGCEEINNMQPGKSVEMNELCRLSGMEKLLHEQYNNHRQSFS